MKKVITNGTYDPLEQAMAGDNIGALLRGVDRDEIERGQVLAKPGTVTCHHKFKAQVYVLTKDEGGHTVGSGRVTSDVE